MVQLKYAASGFGPVGKNKNTNCTLWNAMAVRLIGRPQRPKLKLVEGNGFLLRRQATQPMQMM